MNVKNNNTTIGEMLLKIIDLYNNEYEKQRQNLEKKRKNPGDDVPKFNIGKILDKEPFKEFYETLQNKNPNSDISWFIENLSRLRLWGTFDNIRSAEDAIEDFNKLQIELPKFVLNCFREVETRTFYINSLIDKKKYEWDETKKNNYSSYLNKEFQAYTYNKDSKQKYLTDLFDNIVAEIKETEHKIKTEYGYIINSFYENETFVATKEDLNDFFFYCEKHKRTIDEFYNLFHILSNYIDNKNKLKELNTRIKKNTLRQQMGRNSEVKNFSKAEKIKEKLSFMKGKDIRNGQIILNETDYNQLLSYTLEYFERLEIPENIQPMQTNTRGGNILYTYGSIFKELYPSSKYPENLIIFLHKTFNQLAEKNFENKQYFDTNIYKRLGTKPQYYDEQIKG